MSIDPAKMGDGRWEMGIGDTPPSPKITIRWMISIGRHDLANVLDLEQLQYYPWTEDHYLRTLRKRNMIGWVALDQNDRLTGAAVYLLETRKITLVRLIAAKGAPGRAAEAAILEKLRGRLHPERRNRLVIPVRESNLAAQIYLRDRGVTCHRTIRNHFEDGEDAYIFAIRV